jgi:hypothetical protein
MSLRNLLWERDVNVDTGVTLSHLDIKTKAACTHYYVVFLSPSNQGKIFKFFGRPSAIFGYNIYLTKLFQIHNDFLCCYIAPNGVKKEVNTPPK